MKKKLFLALSICLPLAFTSCSSDDNEDGNNGNENYQVIIASRIPSPDGMTGTTFTQPISLTEGATYSNTNAIETSYACPMKQIGDYYYDFPGYNNDKDELRRYSYANGNFNLVDTYTCPASSQACSLVGIGNKGYLSMYGLGSIQVLDLSSMTLLKTINLTSYDASGDRNPNPGMMIARDGLLYVPLCQSTTTSLPPADRAKADIVIIDTNTDEVLKMITDEQGFSSPGDCMQGNENCLFIDENNDIYVNCVGGRGYLANHKTGLLRIKSGETEFDSSYSFDINSVAFEGKNHDLDKILDMIYTGGKYYCTSYSTLDFSTPANYLADKVVMCLELDLKNKTIKKLPLPMGNIFASCVGKYGNNIIFGLATANAEGFYSYDPATDTCSDKPIINTTGYPFVFQTIE